MHINTTKLRSTYVGGKKAYFVSDIEDCFGKRPVSKLGQNKSIFMERIKHGNNSQKRRLVFHKDLQNLTIEDDTKQSNVKETKQPMLKKLKEYCFKGSKVKHTEKAVLNIPEISLKDIRKLHISLDEERNNLIKDRIKDLCYKEAKKNIKAKGLSKKQITDEDRLIYREPYLILYNTFDRYMRTELMKFNTTLEDIGLGRSKNTSKKPYIDRIAEAGQLNNLLVVAEALFQPKATTNK